MTDVSKEIESIRAAMRAYSDDADSPPMRIIGGMLTLSQKLDAKMSELQNYSPEAMQRAVERAAKTGLEKASAATVDAWRWRMLAAALAVTAVVGGVAYYVGRDVGAADSHHWTAWCGDPKHIDTKLPGGPFCLVPIR